MARTVDPDLTARRRAAILAAAAAEFSSAGFERARAADIAARAGVSSGTVFYYFTDKAGLFRALFDADVERNTELRRRALAEPDPRAAVALVVDALAESAVDPVAPGIAAELIRRVPADPALAEIVATADGLVRSALAEIIDRGQSDGDFDPALDPAHAAAFLVSLTDGAHLADGDVRPDVRRAALAYLRPEEK
ncbi:MULTISPECIES: TetR/AcrR family transcriptional regulator [Tsukamurella]|uniref:TetR family transcriptional regulator n=2 Tax=Tsukamurella TaxID=2060 RepID=A0A5C5S448_9ACTN|nr:MULTISPECIES: TetR/AcrR family transcriptional regulator [Tsukamurella]NMD57480.1 TetR family transcriptional regulator [Tsukamurella columbiensis]TWS29989.1 TetR family transcriptional regulator [Tsukamurella conjunctivitidis]